MLRHPHQHGSSSTAAVAAAIAPASAAHADHRIDASIVMALLAATPSLSSFVAHRAEDLDLDAVLWAPRRALHLDEVCE